MGGVDDEMELALNSCRAEEEWILYGSYVNVQSMYFLLLHF
jgi:hypothetical protein